ncbi:MAG: PAS domain S-box protein [Bacteroidales bacterium]|nr:PAS domain S-box protein [Bacteroidales bacterium]
MNISQDTDAQILIIDNDPIVYYLVKEILEPEGYTTEHAAEGKIALETISNKKIDLILLDIMMPVMDGFEVCARLKEDPSKRHIPIIFMSAKDDDESYSKGFELGAIDYLTKPIKQLDLILKIRNYLKLSRNEISLKESELKYRMLADYNYDWEYWMNPEGRFLYVSPSCERITGYTAEEFTSEPDLIVKITHPDHIEMVRKHYEKEHSKRMEFDVLEHKIIDRYGEVKWINHVCNPVFDSNDIFQGIRGNNRDITRRKEMEDEVAESEKKFRSIFQSSIDGMVICDFKHKVLESNSAFQKVTGLSEANIEQLQLTNFIHSGDKEMYHKWFVSIIRSEIINRPEEFRLLNPKNEVIVMEFNSRVIRYHGGEAVLSILRDVTERKEVHYKILNTIIETEEKERRRFAQDLHDGMGPLLSTIKLYTRSVLTAKDDQNKEIAIEKALETIDEAIAHTKEIAYNISPSILKDFGLVVAVKSYVNKFNDTKKVNIHFQADLNKRVKSNIEASLFRVIIELINNTVKHAHANNAFIEIKLRENNLLVQYSDDGIGFELQPVIEKSKGQGLVNIINRTRSIGGEIAIETDTNKGFNVAISIDVNQQK